MRIGILGGTFNPPHEGHVHISSEAIKELELDELWLLPAKQNPLKTNIDTLSFDIRSKLCEKLIRENDKIPQDIKKKIKISDFETTLESRYTFDIAKKLKKDFPRDEFIWIMGADNLICFHRWYEWKKLFYELPIAVVDRDDKYNESMNSEASESFKEFYTESISDFKSKLHNKKLPNWTYLKIKTHPASSTKIRKDKDWKKKTLKGL